MIKYQTTIFTALMCVCFSHFSAAKEITPIISLLLQDDNSSPRLTDRSNIQCNLTLDSFSPNVGENIAFGSIYTASYSYEISQRPIDVEVRIIANALSNGGTSGVIVGPIGGELVVNIDDRSESMTGQIQLSSENTGVNGAMTLETLSAQCIFFTNFDEEDALNNPGPPIGTRIQFVTPGVIVNTQTVNWILNGSTP